MRAGLSGDDMRLLRQNIDLIALRRQFNLSTRGATLVGLTGIAEQLGLSTRPLSLDLDELNALKLPCILHWEFNHFVVLVSVNGHRSVLHDPARGRRVISLTELSHSFTGVALEAWPGLAWPGLAWPGLAANSPPTAFATAFTCAR